MSDLDEVIELIESSKKLRTEFSFLLVPMKSARAEIERLRLRGDGHAETLRGIANMDPATEGDRMRQWARDGLSGYTGSTESTIKSLMDEIGHAHKCIANTRDALWTYDERPEYARKILDDYWREHAMEQYLPDATPTPDPRDAEIERLEDALQEIASQGRPIEYDAEQQAMADYEAAYDMCVLTARAAIKKSGTTKDCKHIPLMSCWCNPTQLGDGSLTHYHRDGDPNDSPVMEKDALGMSVVVDPAMPDGRIDFVNADGAVVGRIESVTDHE